MCGARDWRGETAGCIWPCASAPGEGPGLLAQHELGLAPPDKTFTGARQSAGQSALSQLPAFSAGPAPAWPRPRPTDSCRPGPGDPNEEAGSPQLPTLRRKEIWSFSFLALFPHFPFSAYLMRAYCVPRIMLEVGNFIAVFPVQSGRLTDLENLANQGLH